MQILFIGDVMLGRLVNSVISKDRFTYVWGDTIDIIRNADLSLINLECAISSKGKQWDKTYKAFHFRANPDAIEVLKTACIDYTSLANNHVLDYDEEALIETLDLLDNNSIAHSGAGRNLKEAMKPAILKFISIPSKSQNKTRGEIHQIDKDGQGNIYDIFDDAIRIGVVSITDNQPEWEAGDRNAGINYIPLTLPEEYVNRLQSCIDDAKKNSDLVIISSHVGPHFREHPSDSYIKFAHKLIDLGADIYWGHSNHMPQGIEIYKNKIIMYDCGDFIDDYAIHPNHRNDLSFIFLLNLDYVKGEDHGEGKNVRNVLKIIDIDLVPTKIYDFRAGIALLDDADTVIDRMVKRCNHLNTKCIVDQNRNKIKIPL